MAGGMGFMDRVFDDQAGKRALLEGRIMNLEAKVDKLVEEMARIFDAAGNLRLEVYRIEDK